MNLSSIELQVHWQNIAPLLTVRNDHEMDNTWRYIESNPSAWAEDDENPSRTLW